MWKLWFHKIKLSNLYKIGKYGKKSGKLSTKSGNIGIFHIVSIYTAPTPDYIQFEFEQKNYNYTASFAGGLFWLEKTTYS